jgi:hypothetical protein
MELLHLYNMQYINLKISFSLIYQKNDIPVSNQCVLVVTFAFYFFEAGERRPNRSSAQSVGSPIVHELNSGQTSPKRSSLASY